MTLPHFFTPCLHFTHTFARSNKSINLTPPGSTRTSDKGYRTVAHSHSIFTLPPHFPTHCVRSNKSINLPPGSTRTSDKGYDTVYIPHAKPKPFKTGEKLRPIAELPEWAQPAFKVRLFVNCVHIHVNQCL